MKRAKRRAMLAPKPQEKFNRRPLRPDEKYTLQGYRVIDLTTVVAGPTVGRILRELGAEVIKVEDQKGDYWRRFFLEFQQPRKWTVGFDVANMGKASIILDLKTKKGMRELKKLLRDADVFITNVRQKALKKLGLDYPSVAKEFPQLVYTHLTAWGQVGPECSLPGYDIGAFHAMSGLSKMIANSDGKNATYSSYPIASGDCCSALTLTSGCLTALSERLSTGKGRYVHTSLLANGVHALSAVFSQMANNDKDFEPHPTHLPYLCKDDKSIQLLGLGYENEQTLEIQRVFGISSFLDESSLKSFLTEQFSGMTRKEVVAFLSGSKVFYCIPVRMQSLLDETGRRAERDYFLQPGKDVGMGDIDSVVRLPFRMSSGIEGVTTAGPAHGAHTDDFLAYGWTNKEARTFLGKTAGGNVMPQHQPLKNQRINIIELSHVGSSVASSARWFADMGATVTKVVPDEPFDDLEGKEGWTDFWADRLPSFGYHLDHGKTKITMNLSNPKLAEMIGDAGLFITNYPISLLKKYRLNPEALRMQYPQLIYALVTPRGMQFAETPVHDIGPFFLDYGFWESYASGMPHTKLAPLQFGEVLTSIPLTLAVNAAILHRRIHGEGNLVHVSLSGAAQFVCFQGWVLIQKTPEILNLFTYKDIKVSHENWPSPLANSYRTKDGVWVMFLGLEVFKHIGNFVKALEMKIIYPKMAKHVLFDIILGNKKESKLMKAMPMFRTMNRLIAQKVASLSHADLKKRLDMYGCWYCYVRDPYDMKMSQQAAANNFFRDCKFRHGKATIVKMPLEFDFIDGEDAVHEFKDDNGTGERSLKVD